MSKHLQEWLHFFLDNGFEWIKQPLSNTTEQFEKKEILLSLAKEAAACKRCALYKTRNKVVFGKGNVDAKLLFIGEAPGRDEDLQGAPFVGRAGKLLTRIIEAMGYRREDVYITNVIKCRPPKNRDPLPTEVEACRSFLETQVKTISPKVICALGRIAAQTLLGVDLPLKELRGRWHTFLNIPLRVTYHPAAILRNPSLRQPTWEDIQTIKKFLENETS